MINTPSIIQMRFKLTKNRRKSRSEMKLNTPNTNNGTEPNTRQPVVSAFNCKYATLVISRAETIFSGVNLI